MAEDRSTTVQLERLNNDEFRQLMPSLQVEELLSIQIKNNDTWEYLFNTSRKKGKINSLLCSACNTYIPYDNFQTHVNLETHNSVLKEVKQFYHPIYTYAKGSDKLAKGLAVSKAELKDGINKAIAAIDHQVRVTFVKAKRVAYNMLKKDPIKFEKTLLSLVLKTDAKIPEHIFADVGLPLINLLTLEFSTEEGKWRPMLTTDNPQPNGKYFCALCSKYCAGIITVNSHLNGFFHKKLQLGTIGFRVPTHRHLTKNCSYRYDEKKYSLTIRREGREFLKDEVWKLIRSSSHGDSKEEVDSTTEDNGSHVNNTVIESNKKSQEYEIIAIEDISDEKEANVNSKAVQELENSDSAQNAKEAQSSVGEQKNILLNETPKPELSKSIAVKAKALSANIPDILNSSADSDSSDIEAEGLIGVEYVVKLMKSANDPAPSYECCLCECVLGEGRMQGHLISYPHRLKYLEMHYPNTVKKYNKDIGHLKYQIFKRVMSPVLAKLASAIEKHHGRSLPYTVSAPRFVKQRPEIVAETYNFNHACQQHGPSFSNVVSSEDIKTFIKNNNLYKPPFVPDNHRGRFITPTDKLYLNQCSHPNKNVKEPKSPNIRQNNYRETYTRSRSCSRSPQRRVSHRAVKTNDIWKLYREKISIAASEVECSYVEYRKNPESHPSYDQEWNRFWKRRKEELVAQGIDHRSYNYQPEWVRFFRNRLEQLFGEELHKSKINVRRRLNIPLDAEEDSQPQATTVLNRSSPKELRRTVYPQQFETHAKPHLKNIEPPIKRQRVENQNFDFPMATIEDDKPNIIHVLRLMTALENHLGSLGSKIMDLLSRTLVLEKKCSKNPKELERQILTASNCTLLETAMEKLKGILYAGLLDGNKVQGFNKVIQSTADLLKHADDMGWRNAYPEEYLEKSNNTTNDLQKLIEVMQNNKKSELPLLNQKSLSDTLKELITFQNRSPSRDPLTNPSKQYYLSHDLRSNNETRSNSSAFIGSSFMDSASNSNDRFKQNNPYPSTLFGVNEVEVGGSSIKQTGLSNFNTRLNRNVPLVGGVYAEQVGGIGRNNYNNMRIDNSNHNKAKDNATDIGNIRSRNDSTFQTKIPSFRPQTSNYSQLSNMAQTTNFNQNSLSSWDRFQNIQQWSFNPQSQQYEHK